MLQERQTLSNNLQRILKWLHVTFAAIMVGGVFSLLIIQLTKHSYQNPTELFFFDLSMYRIFDFAVVYPFYALFFTALIYALFTKWGFFTHYWIIAKWIALVLMLFLVLMGLGPVVNGMVALADGGFLPDGSKAEYLSLAHKGRLSVLIFGLLLLLTVCVSIIKPWGMRKSKRRVNRKLLIISITTVLVILLAMGIFNSVTLNKVRQLPIADPDLNTLAEGTYRGGATFGGFTYQVEVDVAAHRIQNLRILKNRHSPYARYAAGVLPRIIRQQSPNVAAITGATTTSKMLMKAVANALKKKNE